MLHFACVAICSKLMKQVILGEMHLHQKDLVGWNKMSRFKKHVGGVNSVHNQCVKRCEDLMMQRKSIQTSLGKQSEHPKLIIGLV